MVITWLLRYMLVLKTMTTNMKVCKVYNVRKRWEVPAQSLRVSLLFCPEEVELKSLISVCFSVSQMWEINQKHFPFFVVLHTFTCIVFCNTYTDRL